LTCNGVEVAVGLTAVSVRDGWLVGVRVGVGTGTEAVGWGRDGVGMPGIPPESVPGMGAAEQALNKKIRKTRI